MLRGPERSVAESLSRLSLSSDEGMTLQDGSRVAVVGGGPAGSFFAYFLTRFAEAIDLSIDITVYEPRSFERCGPAGCNHCGGIVSESLVQILATEGINLPKDVVRRGIEAYTVHSDVGEVSIDSPVMERRIAALYRGNGPRCGEKARLASFDHHLVDLARRAGANYCHEMVSGINWHDGYPHLAFRQRNEEPYDLVAVACGINSNLPGAITGGDGGFKGARVTRGYICEFEAGEEKVRKLLGNRVHIFLLPIPRFEFAAIIPKGPYATVVMVGDDIDAELVNQFLRHQVVQSVLPTEELPCVCGCSPQINLGARGRPYADRLVLIGDAGVTRLYKDGIGAAYRTGKSAAETAVFNGVSAEHFRRFYWPTCRSIANDNAVGRLIFASNSVLKISPLLRRVVLKMAENEQSRDSSRPHMSTLLWNMFTGSEPYTEMMKGALNPGFIANFLAHLFREGGLRLTGHEMKVGKVS